MIYIFLLIVGLFSSPNDVTGLNFLKEYDTEYLSYHHLSVGLNEYGYLGNNSYNSVDVYGNFYYYRRVYSKSKDFYFWVQPYQYFDFYEGDFFLSSSGYMRGAFQLYPLSFPVFTLIQGDLSGDYSKRSGTHILKSGMAEVEVGLGFGRIVPLYDAYKTLKIEEELINLGELSGKFDRRDLEKISEQIIRKEKYLDERNFWRDLDSIITETENFKNDRLNAVSAIRINRILGTDLRTRLSSFPSLSGVDRGYETGLYLGYNYHYYSRTDELGDEDYMSKEKEIYAGVRYDVAHPISVKLHLYGHSSGEAYISDSLGFKEINLEVGLNYEIFNSFLSGLSIEYLNNTGRYYVWGRDEERFSLICRNLYYIDYKLSISVNGSFSYFLRRGSGHADLFRGSLSASLNYNFF